MVGYIGLRGNGRVRKMDAVESPSSEDRGFVSGEAQVRPGVLYIAMPS